MRLLNSVCKLIAGKYKGVPVYIGEVPEGFTRPSFLVSLATESSTLKNKNVYEDTPIYQIDFFSRTNAANQAYPEELYRKLEELKALFLLPGAIPVIPKQGVKEKQRYAKVTLFSSEIRLAEKRMYVKVGLSFTEDTAQEKTYDLMKEVDMEMTVRKE